MTIDVASMIEQSLIGVITPFIVSAATVFIICIIFLTYRYCRLSKSGIHAIYKMSGADFETRLAILFKKLGYSVKQNDKITNLHFHNSIHSKKELIEMIKNVCVEFDLLAKQWNPDYTSKIEVFKTEFLNSK